MENILLFCGIGLLGFSLSLVCVPFSRRVSRLLRAVDVPVPHKVHSSPMPRLGGLAIYGGFWLSILVLRLFYPEPLVGFEHKLAGLFAGSSLVLAIGVLDDIFGLGAFLKLVVEVGAAILVVSFGFRVMPEGSLSLLGRFGEVLVFVGSAVWLVWVTNVFNLADGLDGLAAGIGGIVSLSTFVISMSLGIAWVGVLSIILFGVCSGFLVHNFPPARIFMGDAGSYFLGYMLGVTAIEFTYLPKDTRVTALMPIALPFILFAVPFYDTLSVICIRIIEGRHIFDADKRHFSHRLTDLGLNKREAVLTIYAATLATSFPALYLRHLNRFSLLGAVVQALLVLLVVAILEHAGARAKPDA